MIVNHNGTKEVCGDKDKTNDMISTNSYALSKDISVELTGRQKGLIVISKPNAWNRKVGVIGLINCKLKSRLLLNL